MANQERLRRLWASGQIVGREVLVSGKHLRTVSWIYPHIDGGVRVDRPVDKIFRSWNIDELVLP